MRCNHCNVDLEDKQQKCPLCGKPAANVKPRIPRVTAAYPANPGKKTDYGKNKNNNEA